MGHQLRAQYEVADEPGKVVGWHMVRNGTPDQAMCGRDIDAHAQSVCEGAWGRIQPMCRLCGSLYLHEVAVPPVDDWP